MRQLVSCCKPERGSKENWRARAPEEFAIIHLHWGVSTFSASTSVTCADFLHSVSLWSLIHLVLHHIHTYTSPLSIQILISKGVKVIE